MQENYGTFLELFKRPQWVQFNGGNFIISRPKAWNIEFWDILSLETPMIFWNFGFKRKKIGKLVHTRANITCYIILTFKIRNIIKFKFKYIPTIKISTKLVTKWWQNNFGHLHCGGQNYFGPWGFNNQHPLIFYLSLDKIVPFI